MATTNNTKQRRATTAKAALTLVMSFGCSNTDRTPIQKTLTWEQLVSQFSKPDTKRGKLPLAKYLALNKADKTQKKTRDQEKNGPYFIMAAFSKSNTRDAADIAYMSGFTGDLDTGKFGLDELKAKLSGFQYLVYSSYSHSSAVPMWRFILMYSRQVTMTEHEKVYAYFQQAFDNQLDRSCKNPAQLWYTPACPPDAGAYFEVAVGEGDLLDPDTIPEVLPTAPSKSTALAVIPLGPIKSLPSYQLSRLRSALETMPADDRDVWIRVGLALRQELGVETGYALWLEWSKKSDKFDEDDAEATWSSFKDTAPGAAVTLGTVFYLAKESGWVDHQRDMHPNVKAIDDRHFMAFEGGKSWVFKEDYDEELGRPMLTRTALRPFAEYYANQTTAISDDKKTVMHPTVTLWHNHPARRSFEKIVFMPGQPTPQGCYNLWRGFAYPPVQGDWSLLHQHIHDVICNGDADCAEYLLNWLANAIQFPDRLGEVAVVMKGERGTGKGKLAHLIALLFGEHGLQITQSRHLIGNFNAHLRTCVFLFVDEAIWAGDKEGENVLKGLVTEPTIQIEKKHIDATVSRNRLHIMMASNNEWVVPAGNRERRYCVLQVNESHIQDSAYFAAIDDQMLNHGGLSAMMYDLQQRDLSAFNVRQFPWTDALDEQILRTLDPAMQWWMDYLGTTYARWGYLNRSSLSQSFAEANGTFNGKSSATKLGIFLSSVVPGGVKKVSYAPVAGASPEDCYHFPPQQECREALMKKLGLKNDPWL